MSLTLWSIGIPILNFKAWLIISKRLEDKTLMINAFNYTKLKSLILFSSLVKGINQLILG